MSEYTEAEEWLNTQAQRAAAQTALYELMQGDIPCRMSINGKYLDWDALTNEWVVREWLAGRSRRWNELYRGTDEDEVKRVLREGWDE